MHESQTAEALRMLDVFASIGARCFDIEHVNLDQQHRGFRRAQTLEQARGSMPFLVDSAAQRHNNLIVRPHADGATLIQLDDLPAATLDRVRPVAFLILNTSPGNFQAWLAVRGAGDDADLRRRVKKATGADPSASGATRVAGTMNFKRKYEPNFPTVAIQEAQPGKTVTPAELEALGLIAPPDPPRPATVFRNSKGDKWPSYEQCLDAAPLNHGGDAPDVSRADFTFALIAIDWGHPAEQVAARLMEYSTKARENGQRYADLTARKAASIVATRTRRPGPSA
jgi:DNA primase RepB-like protein